jgi:hypothetical protein
LSRAAIKQTPLTKVKFYMRVDKDYYKKGYGTMSKIYSAEMRRRLAYVEKYLTNVVIKRLGERSVEAHNKYVDNVAALVQKISDVRIKAMTATATSMTNPYLLDETEPTSMDRSKSAIDPPVLSEIQAGTSAGESQGAEAAAKTAVFVIPRTVQSEVVQTAVSVGSKQLLAATKVLADSELEGFNKTKASERGAPPDPADAVVVATSEGATPAAVEPSVAKQKVHDVDVAVMNYVKKNKMELVNALLDPEEALEEAMEKLDELRESLATCLEAMGMDDVSEVFAA